MHVTTHCADQFLILHVPDLNLPVIRPHAQMRALLRPSDASYTVSLTQIDKLADTRCVRVPNVDMLGQGYG